MFRWLVSRIWNRRKDQNRYPLGLTVRAVTDDGDVCEMVSEDLSDRGVRLQASDTPLSLIMDKHGEAPLEICLEEEVSPVKVKAQIIWTYSLTDGGTMSGWQFMNFHGNARRRLRSFLDRMAEEQAGREDDAEATV